MRSSGYKTFHQAITFRGLPFNGTVVFLRRHLVICYYHIMSRNGKYHLELVTDSIDPFKCDHYPKVKLY